MRLYESSTECPWCGELIDTSEVNSDWSLSRCQACDNEIMFRSQIRYIASRVIKIGG